MNRVLALSGPKQRIPARLPSLLGWHFSGVGAESLRVGPPGGFFGASRLVRCSWSPCRRASANRLRPENLRPGQKKGTQLFYRDSIGGKEPSEEKSCVPFFPVPGEHVGGGSGVEQTADLAPADHAAADAIIGRPGCGQVAGTPVHYLSAPPDATWPRVIPSGQLAMRFRCPRFRLAAPPGLRVTKPSRSPSAQVLRNGHHPKSGER